MMAGQTTGHIIHMLELEKYIPVMSRDELDSLAKGQCEFDASTVGKWQSMIAAKNNEMNIRFAAAYKKQEELCRPNTAK